MAREYDPPASDIVQLSIKKVRRAGSRFYVAMCKQHGEVDTATTQSGAATILGDHMARKHPGRTMRLETK